MAAFGTFALARFLLRKGGLEAENAHFPALFGACYVAGWFGARALSIVVEQFEVTTPGYFFLELFRLGPMTFYGGFVLASAVGIALAWRSRAELNLRSYADAVFPAAILGLGIGRIGCFLNGDDYGRQIPEGSWWAVVFPNLQDGVPRYATQLQEAGVSFLIAAWASWVFIGQRQKHDGGEDCARRKFAPGQLACFAIAASALNRFGNEFFRGDSRGSFFGSALSTSQGIAFALVLMALICAICFFNRAAVNRNTRQK